MAIGDAPDPVVGAWGTYKGTPVHLPSFFSGMTEGAFKAYLEQAEESVKAREVE